MTSPMPIPRGVRAAFPLEEFGGRMAWWSPRKCLTAWTAMSPFSMSLYTVTSLRPASQLAIAQKAQAENNHLWEINMPFPYGNEGFIDAYTRLEQALAQRDLPAVIETRTILHDLLAPMEYEYMLWQEWKEGFARWLENRMQSALNLSLNHRGGHEPFTRVSFYARGAGLVALLAENDPALVNDLERLFHQLDGLGQ